jgi:TolB-like protein/DNA-binding winged helix-turn-helix (wHTH) protein/tetratricopeptide (TPR) repeat protein
MAGFERYAFGDFVLERSQQRVLRRDGTELGLTPRLFNALLLFVERAGLLLDKDTMLQALWPGLVVEENNLSQVVSGLRRALGDDSQGSRFIQTVPRRGFRFVATVTPLAEAPSAPAREIAVAPTPADAAASAAPGPAEAAVTEALPRSGERRSWLRLALAAGAAAGFGAAGWWAWPRGRPAPEALPAPTLAVLPFKPAAAQGRDELLEIGMADTIATRLSTQPGLAVVATASVLRFAGPAQDPRQAARELDADWIVDGTLARGDAAIRVSARLLDAADGSTLWSGSWDEPFVGVFKVQEQIASRVTQALAARLPSARHDAEPLGGLGGTLDTDAYQLFLAAAWRAQGSAGDSTDKALTLLHQALEIDPAYAQAWSLTAWVHRRKLWRNDARPSEVFAASNAAVDQALRLAPNLAQAHAGRAFSRYWFDFDWAAGEAGFRTALVLNPNEVSAQWGLAQMLFVQGRVDPGFVHLRRARELDPMSPVMNALEAGFLIDAGRLDEARVRLNRAFDIAPEHGLALQALAWLRLAENRPDEAIGALRRAAATSSGTSHPRALLALQLARHGGQAEARTILDSLLERARTRFVPPTLIATVHAGLGENEAALALLEQALPVRDPRLVYLNVDHAWDTLRREPRFVALKRALGMEHFGPGLASV